MPTELIPFDVLQAITGYSRLADVERCLQRQGIRYFRGRGTVWTTLDLLNAAGGLTPGANSANDPYSPDMAA